MKLLLLLVVSCCCVLGAQAVACNSTTACAAGNECTSNVCTACPVGKYKSAASTAACTTCYAHSNATSTGQSVCLCLPGYQSLGLFHVCTACPIGKYKAATSNGNCTACADVPHYTTATTASSTPNACGCAAGYFAATAGGTACKACDQGSYTDTVRSTTCTNCSLDGYASIGAHATSCALCPTGYTNNSANTLCSIDVDECTMGTANCTDVCTNIAGGYTCSCLPDTTRQLQADGYTCADPGEVGSGTTTTKGLLIAAFSVSGVIALAAWGGAKYGRTRLAYGSGAEMTRGGY